MIAGGIEMPNEKRHTVEYLLTAMLAIFILYCMVYISNTIDMPEYKRCLKEQGMAENEIDIINIYNITRILCQSLIINYKLQRKTV